MKKNAVLTIKNMFKRFGGLVAVDDVSFDVYPGEVVALLGDNGAGKSTIIKCISGVYQAEQGEIYFEGKLVDFSHPSEARRHGIETIYQDLALANNLDVSSNIFLGREIEKNLLASPIKVLDNTFMLDEAHKAMDSLDINISDYSQAIENLSGGQRQAVAIARAAYWNAKLMIMDEPTNNLGVPEQQKVLGLIRKLRDEGVPIILISHTLPDVFAVSDRLIVLHRGRIVTEKKASETNSQEIVQYMVGSLDDSKQAK